MDFINTEINEFKKQFQSSMEPLRVSFRSLCSEWDWARRSEAYTHLMHKYPAKIFPYIPIFFLSSKDYATADEYVLDPFAGTATVLLESITHPYIRRNAIGAEINPLARLIAKVKTTPLDIQALKKETENLISRVKSFHSDVKIPEFSNRDLWFSRRIQTELAKLRICIDSIADVHIRDFFLVCYSSIIRDVSLADPRIAPPILLKPEHFVKNPKRQREVETLLRKKKMARPLTYFVRAVKNNLKRVETLNSIDDIHNGKVSANIIWDDAKELKKGRLIDKAEIDKSEAEPLGTGSIGLVITSPPYINAQKYIRTTRLELLWLGLVNEKEIAALDRQFVGTERIFSSECNELSLTGIGSADSVIKRIYQKNRQRAGIVSRYFLDMRQIIGEIHRVLKKGGRFILVVGDNTICGEQVNNHQILTDIATQELGFELEVAFVDSIRSRGMITKRHETGGLVLDDWVIVLKKEQ